MTTAETLFAIAIVVTVIVLTVGSWIESGRGKR